MKSIIEYFIKYSTWPNVFKLMILIFGLIALVNLKSSFFPELESRNIQISVVYPGASAEEVEQGIVQKIEDKLKGLQGIERYTSKSLENLASITIEVFRSYDVDAVLQDVKNSVNSINSFPPEIEPPVIAISQFSGFAISFTITGDMTLAQLKKVTKEAEDDLRNMDGISQVAITGYPNEEINIGVRESVLREYGISFDQVAQAVRQANIDLSAGMVKTTNEEFMIRMRSKEYFSDAFDNIIIRSEVDGRTVTLSEIANVEDSWEENPRRSYIDGKPATTIAISKTLSEDILDISQNAKDYIEKFNEKHKYAKAQVLDDFTVSLRQRLDTLLTNGMQGAILVLLTLSLFLNLRIAFWVALGIPFSFLGMFLIMYLTGGTINVISLFGCIIVVGILVDDGIVMSEQIYQNFERGEPAFKAAYKGSMQVVSPVVFAVLTTIAVFIPFFFLEGRQGENMRDMAFVVVITIAFSLFESILILPSHLAHSTALSPKNRRSKFREKLDKILYYPRDTLYKHTLKFFLKHKLIALALAISLTIVTVGGFKSGIIGLTFFPFLDTDSFDIELKLPAGAPETKTKEILDRISKATMEVNEDFKKLRPDGKSVIDKVVVNVGIGSGSFFGMNASSGANLGTVKIVLLNPEERQMPSYLIKNAIRDKVGPVYGVEQLTYGQGSRFGKPISISMISKNLEDLENARKELKDGLHALPEVKDISDNSPAGVREIDIKLNDQAKVLGLNNLEVMRQIRQGFFGEEVQRLQRGDDEVKVWVRYDLADRRTLGNLDEMRIRTAKGQEFPLNSLADFTIKSGVSIINHLDGRRELTVDADMTDETAEVPPILSKINSTLVDPILAKYKSVSIAESGQTREILKTGRSSRVALSVGIAIMYLLVVLSIRSFMQGALIFSLIPLGFIGAVWGHALHGFPVNMMSAYGLIALMGIIVNNSIVYVDTYQEYLRSGQKVDEALLNAGLNRFRPILLTTMTTVLGLSPLIFEKSFQAQFLIPMAISLAYGLLIGSLLTIMYLPVILAIYNRFLRLLKWIWTGEWVSPESVEPSIIQAKKIAYYVGDNGATNEI